VNSLVFHTISEPIRKRMRYLEQIDTKDRQDGTPVLKRLRQIPPETGKFIALLAANTPDGEMIEIGTSAGYSTLWLSLVCEETGRSITTFEVLLEKAQLARETFQTAQVEDIVRLVQKNALEVLPEYEKIAFCFLDADKAIYVECYEAVIPRLVRGGMLAVDNVISHQEELQPVVERALSDVRVDALVVPIGKGVLVCRKV
jgi:caffeoyl-CoA O-methyltransferase